MLEPELLQQLCGEREEMQAQQRKPPEQLFPRLLAPTATTMLNALLSVQGRLVCMQQNVVGCQCIRHATNNAWPM